MKSDVTVYWDSGEIQIGVVFDGDGREWRLSDFLQKTLCDV